MSVRIASRWVSLNVLLGFVLFVGGEHFYLPKENNVFSNDPQDDWVPISGIDKRSTRPNHGVTKIVHITPPVRFPHRSSDLQLQAMSASNKVEVFAQPPPTVLGSFTEFGHSTVEAREPAHALNFRPSYHFERQHRDEINDRRYQEPEEQTHPSVVVFNAQQRHPQNYLKPTPPQQYYQNYVPYYNGNGNNNKNFGFKEPPAVVQEAQIVPKRLTPYSVSNDHVFPRPQQQQLPGNSKLQAYAEQRPPKHPYPVNPAEQQLQRYQQPQHQQQQQQQQKQQQQHYQQTLQQQQQQQQHNQKQPYRTSAAEGAVQSSAYFHKYYPGQVIDGQNPFPEVSNFARPFEQITTNDHDVYIRPNQHVHNLNVGTEVRFGPEPSTRATALQQEPTTGGGVTHPATRPFSKYQTPSPKNEELYRIFPVKEVNALPPAFLPTPIAPHTPKAGNGRPKAPNDAAAAAAAAVGSSEYDESQNENDSGEQYYDIVRSRTKPMMTTTTTATTTTTTTTTSAPPRSTRKKKPSTTTAAAPPDEYDEYAAAVHNSQQLQLQEHDEHQPQQHAHGREPTAAEPNGDVPPQPPAVSVNKYKKKKPLPAARPKEPVRPERPNESPTERAAAADPPPTVSSSTAVAATAAAAAPATTVPSGGGGAAEAATAADARAKAKLKYGNGTRPRFSIKDYRTTTAPSTAAAPTEAAPTDTATGGRKPYKPRTNRYRTSAASRATEEPPAAETTTMTMTTTTTTTDRNAYRSKYKPGKYYSRSRTTTSTESAAAAAAADETATVATAEPTRPAAVYSAKRRTVAARTTASPAEENSAALRRGSSAAPLIGGGAEEMLGAASSEDADYATTAVAAAMTRPKYQAADRPLLPIESFFQSSMGGKRHRHSERR